VDTRTGSISREWFHWLLAITGRVEEEGLVNAFASAESVAANAELEKKVESVEIAALRSYPDVGELEKRLDDLTRQFVSSVNFEVTDHGDLTGLADDDHTQYLLHNGTRALTADWDAGSFEIRAQTFESDVVTGTAPLVIASTTKVTNLNADLLDDQTGSYYLDSANFTGVNWTDLTDGGDTTLHQHSAVTVANEATDTTCFLNFTTAATGNLQPKTNTNATFNSSTGVVTLASAVLTTADINGGTVDGVAIGGASASTGAFTTISATGTVTLSGTGANIATGSNFISWGGTDAGLSFDSSNNATLSSTLTTLSTFSGSGAGSAYGTGSSGVQTWRNGTTPAVDWINSTGAADEKICDVILLASSMRFRFLNDAHSAASNWLEVTRSGNTATAIDFTGTAASFSGTLKSTGIGAVGTTVSTTTNLNLAAGTTGVSSLRVPHGAAPTAPVDGDIWTTTAGLYVRINGSTVGPLS
jgi:hypothetical protein